MFSSSRLTLPLAWVLFVAVGCAGSSHVIDAEVLRARAAKAPPDGAYLRDLIVRSRSLDLGHHTQWLRLGHYRTAPFSETYESEVDGPDFFLSPRGKTDPQAELEATLRAFFAKPDPSLKEQPLCHYPARFAFLQHELGLDLQRLQLPECKDFLTFVAEANPRSVTMVFSSYYLNNPASAFGHTFLRLNKGDTMAIGQRRELLDYAIDFSADVDTGNAIIYALKGLLGGFPGTVKRMPFYYKVRKYNDYESRDMWEYELEFSPQELYMLLAHIWEVGHTYFDYYYLSENCSYRILLLLEAAKPSLNLTEQLLNPVLPTDTIKALYDNPGFVRRVLYRPSARTRFEHDVQGLTSSQRALVDDLADDAELPLPPQLSKSEQVQVLDAAADLVDLRFLQKIVMHEDAVAAERKRRLLERRAGLAVPSPQTELQPPWDKAAERGHGSKRFGMAGGYRDPSAGFVAFDFRLAMHDLADPSDGYPDLSQIDFLPTRLRAYPRPQGLRFALDDFSVVSIVSLNSVSRFDLAPSWRFSIGARTLEHEGCAACLAAKFRLGAGPAFAFADQAITLFLTIDTLVYSGPELSGIARRAVRAGLGPSPGLRVRFNPNWVWLLTGDLTWYPEQADPLIWQADSVFRFSYAHNQALSLEARARRDRREVQLFALTYF
jgi:hypothetical protein